MTQVSRKRLRSSSVTRDDDFGALDDSEVGHSSSGEERAQKNGPKGEPGNV